MSANRSLWQIAADPLQVRKPTRLAIDGLLLILASVLLAELFDAFRLAEASRGAAPSVAGNVLKPSTAFGLLSSAL